MKTCKKQHRNVKNLNKTAGHLFAGISPAEHTETESKNGLFPIFS